MTSTYVMEQRVIGPHKVLDIDETRYFSLLMARTVLADALAFEQGYELMIGNFIQMEIAFTEISLRSTLEMDHQHPTLAATLRDANRQVINVLTAIRSYVDQAPQLFKALDLTPKFAASVKATLNDMHAASPDYRFVYELRNHVQHQGTAVHGYEMPLVLRSDSNGWAEAVILTASKSQLALSDFKAPVLAEQPDKIDVRHRIRMSLVALGGVHLKLRAIVESRVNASRATIEAAIGAYLATGAESAVGLAARRVGDKEADVPLLLEWEDVRRALVEKNSQVPRLWPRTSHREPTVADIVAARSSAGHTVADAAKSVFVPEVRWADWEAGLPMPEGLFVLYQLQVGKHATHDLTPRPRIGEEQPTSPASLPADDRAAATQD